MPTRKLSRVAPRLKTVDAYLSNPADDAASQMIVAIDRIRLPLKQPRRYFNPEKQAQLIASVREHGILEPLLVRPLQDDEYELVAGERRLRAAKEAGLVEVPVVSKEFDNKQALQVSLIENLQREDLNPVEETEAVLELLAIELDCTTGEVVSVLNQAHNAKKRGQELTHIVMGQLEKIDSLLVGVGRFTADSFRANRLPLLNLPLDVLEALRQGKLEYTKAQAIARVKEDKQRQKLLKEAITQNLSLSEIRSQISASKPEPEPTPARVVITRMTEITKRLQKSNIWDDRKKRDRITKLLDELEKLAAEC